MATTTKAKSTSTDMSPPERRRVANPRGSGVLNRAGRPKGAKNVFNTQVKEAIVEAAAQLGENGRGKNGLVGFLKAAAKDPDTKGQFLTLLGRVIPYQVTGPSGPTPIIIHFDKEVMGVM